MPCIPLPKVPTPQLPEGITFGISLPLPTFDPNLCCKLPPIPIPPTLPIVAFGALLPLMPVINSTIKKLTDFINSQALDCPREVEEAIAQATT